jgi:hypothetical protein
MRRLFAGLGTLAACAALLSGCVPPKAYIASTKDEDYAKEPKRLLVIETVGDELGRYHDSFKSVLTQRMKDCGATIDFMDRPPRNPLALDNSTQVAQQRQEQEREQQLNADTILQITQLWKTTTQTIPPETRMIGYALQLVDLSTQKVVWKADVRLFTSFDIVTLHDPGITFADDTMTKLAQDRIFRSCAAAAAASAH